MIITPRIGIMNGFFFVIVMVSILRLLHVAKSVKLFRLHLVLNHRLTVIQMESNYWNSVPNPYYEDGLPDSSIRFISAYHYDKNTPCFEREIIHGDII